MNLFSKFLTRFCLLVLVLNPTSILAQSSTPEWTRTLNSKVTAADRGKALARDNSGNLWVYGELTANSFRPTLLLRKFDASQTLLWEVGYHNSQPVDLVPDQAIDVQVDASGNAYTLSNAFISNATAYDILLRKYDPNGGLLWSQSFDHSGQADAGTELHVDAAGNATIFGYSEDITTFTELLVLRYESNGNLAYQYRRSGQAITQIPQDMVVTDDGRTIVTGGKNTLNQVGSTLDFSLTLIDTAGTAVWDTMVGNVIPQSNLFHVYELTLDPADNIYVLAKKIDSLGHIVNIYKFSQTGVQLDTFSSPLIPTLTVEPKGLTVDAQGQVFYSYGYVDPNQDKRVNLVKLDQNLDLLWETVMDTLLTIPLDQRHSLKWTANGNLVTIGQTQFMQGNLNQSDLLYLEYDTAGVKVKDLVWPGPGNGIEKVSEFEMDGNGMAWITGVSSASNLNQDFAAIRIDPTPGTHWSSLKDSETNGEDEIKAITVDHNSHIWVGGRSKSTYSLTSTFLAKYDPAGNLVWDTLFVISDQHLYLKQLLADANGNVYALANSDDYLYLIKFSSSGSILWMDDIPKGNALFFSSGNASLAEGPNGNIYLGQNLVKTASHSAWFLASYAPNGTQNWTWESPIALGQDHAAIHSVVPFNGGVVAGGKMNQVATAHYLDATGTLVNSISHYHQSNQDLEFALDPSGNPVFFSELIFGGGVDHYLIKFDQVGNLLFERRMNQSPIYNSTANVMKLDANANIYLGGRGNAYASYTGKFKPNSDLIWEQLGTSSNSSQIGIEDILPTPDGGLFFTGRHPQNLVNVALVGRNDPAGNPTWYHHHSLGDYISSEGRLLANGPGGELYMAGNAQGDTLFGDFLLVKIGQITAKEDPIATDGLLLYPNPCQDRIIAQRPADASDAVLQVIDLQGRVLLSKDVPAHELETVVNTSSLSAGLYFIRMESAGVETLVQKFRVE